MCWVVSPQLSTGISSETILKHSSINEEELLDLIFKLNTDHRVDGLLVQLPLPGTENWTVEQKDPLSVESYAFVWRLFVTQLELEGQTR